MKFLTIIEWSQWNEKEPDKFQQYEKEKNPRLSCQNVYPGREVGPKSQTSQGSEKIDRLKSEKRSMEKQSFGKQVRISRKRDYLTVYQQGVRSHSKHFTIIVYKNEMGVSRLGITVSKKVGSAVERNRIKRLVREFFRLNSSRLSTPQDIVIIAKRNMPELAYQDVYTELGNHLIKRKDA